jgi:osmotically-inducible protein OsmY
MMKLSRSVFAAAGLALVGTVVLGCTTAQGAKKDETAGEYVDDSVITAKVKTALLNEPTLKSFQINVKTYQGTVQLSGFVDNSQSVQLAGRVAKGVSGVTTVKNDLIVK